VPVYELATPDPKKPQPSALRSPKNFLSPSSQDQAVLAAKASLPPSPIPSPIPNPDTPVSSPPPTSRMDANQRRDADQGVANAVDAYFDDKREKDADEALKDPKRKLKWNPDIKPADVEYQTIRAKIHKKLEDGSVLDVVTEYFEEVQKLLIQPPARDSIVLKIQKENGAKYREALAPGGAFHGKKDNMTTKLTMLHFGLPVEAMTLNNVRNAGVRDENDEEDTPEDLPRIQRIMFSEKPLEFLDLYGDRSFGFPMLRSNFGYSMPRRPQTDESRAEI
jgi:hypothetical protein